MRYGRTLLAGLGWAGTLGGLALCVLIFLSAYLAFDDDRPGVQPRQDGVVRLPSVPDAELPRVPLARPPSRIAGGRSALVAAAEARPRARPARGRAAPRARRRSSRPRRRPPAGARRRGRHAVPRGGADRASGSERVPCRRRRRAPTLGDTTREVVGAVGTEVGQISPPAGQVIQDTGDTLGDAVDALTPRR